MSHQFMFKETAVKGFTQFRHYILLLISYHCFCMSNISMNYNTHTHTQERKKERKKLCHVSVYAIVILVRGRSIFYLSPQLIIFIILIFCNAFDNIEMNSVILNRCSVCKRDFK